MSPLSRKPRKMPKLELLDRLVTLLQERHGGEEEYARRVKELGTKHGRQNLAADDTHFSSMDMTSMELIIEALEKPECDTRRDQHEWDVWTLSEEHIKEIASRKRISLNGVYLDDVAHYVKKGLQSALDNWDEIVYNAICIAEKHPLCIDCSQQLEGIPEIQLCSSCSENYDLDRVWAQIDESKLDVLDFNENAKLREQFKRQR